MPCNAKGNVVASEWLPSAHVNEWGDRLIRGSHTKHSNDAVGRSHPLPQNLRCSLGIDRLSLAYIPLFMLWFFMPEVTIVLSLVTDRPFALR